MTEKPLDENYKKIEQLYNECKDLSTSKEDLVAVTMKMFLAASMEEAINSNNKDETIDMHTLFGLMVKRLCFVIENHVDFLSKNIKKEKK